MAWYISTKKNRRDGSWDLLATAILMLDNSVALAERRVVEKYCVTSAYPRAIVTSHTRLTPFELTIFIPDS